MKAAVYKRYGNSEVVDVQEIDTPQPRDRQVLIKVIASTVSIADTRLRAANFPRGFGMIGRLVAGVRSPRQSILGTELSGVIVSVGKKVKHLQIGDAVIAVSGARMGAHAEYVCFAEGAVIVSKPENLSFEQAAALSFGGQTALYFLRDRARLQPGESLLVVGAGGAVGSAAVQLAKFFGASITGVCGSAKQELVKGLGAQSVIDYTNVDFTRIEQEFDVIFDTTGTVSASQCRNILKPGGRLVLVAADLVQMLQTLWPTLGKKRKILTGYVADKRESVQWLADLAGEGKFQPVIDQSYPFAEIAAAHAYVDQGHKKGSVVITMV